MLDKRIVDRTSNL